MKKITFILMLYIAVIPSIFSNINNDLKTAENFVNLGNVKAAIKTLQGVLKRYPDNIILDKVQLKIARLTSDHSLKVNEYRTFLNTYTKSRYRFLARYELGMFFILNDKLEEAQKEFNTLSQLSRGTPYWHKALINLAKIEVSKALYKNAISILYRIIESVDDYEDIGKTYFYLGYIFFEQELYDDAEHFFLICSGSFPQSSKSSASLLFLLNIYERQNRLPSFEKIYKILNQIYPGAPEIREANILLKSVKSNPNQSAETKSVELINITNYKDIRLKSMARLKEDLDLSFIHLEGGALKQSTYYLQLGYFSAKENSIKFSTQITDKIGTKPEIRVVDNNGKIFYRVMVGPYKNRSEANIKLIELKEKTVESMIIESD